MSLVNIACTWYSKKASQEKKGNWKLKQGGNEDFFSLQS